MPFSSRRNVIKVEQGSHSQKYSTMLEPLTVGLSDRLKAGSASSRKSLPSLRLRNDLKHEGLAHFANIEDPLGFFLRILFLHYLRCDDASHNSM